MRVTLSAFVVLALVSGAALGDVMLDSLKEEASNSPEAGLARVMIDGVRGIAAAGAPGSDKGRQVTNDEVMFVVTHTVLPGLLDVVQKGSAVEREFAVPPAARLALDLLAVVFKKLKGSSESEAIAQFSLIMWDLVEDLQDLDPDASVSDFLSEIEEAIERLKELVA